MLVFCLVFYYIFGFTCWESPNKVEYIVRQNKTIILFVRKNNVKASGTDIWFKSLAVLFENLSHTEKSDNTVSAFITILNMMLVSIVYCEKTLLALELVVDLSPRLDAIVEPLAILNSLREDWQVSSVESAFIEFVDDDFMQGLPKDNRISWRIFISLFVALTMSMHEILGHLWPYSFFKQFFT